ncbi:YbbR-like domain-containing protein [Paludibacter sp. 221]|uniref:CdaR family protein n=1 Tax=Paludibacter sp. 221 TaxID=2302939 RepID=UPI0013D5263A|nr:YbbR-like domain-containing protein [Paludibacter sp. 221]NDV45956.1 YbbR-like domain-containing protein [Paludibacter sp. 221]
MSENRGIQVLKDILRWFKAFLFSKDALSFLFFLLLSAGFWFVNAVNKDRDANITVPLRYSGLPQGLTISNHPPEEIKIGVRDEGLNLFSYSRKKLQPLNIDLSQADTTKSSGIMKISSEKLVSRFSGYLQPTTTITNFPSDTIFVQYEKQDAVVLPVRLNADIELAQQYILSDSIQVTPGYITAYGTKEVLAKLKEVQTEPLDLKQLKDSVLRSCRLLPVEFVSFSVNEVTVKINVEMFTEKKVEIPVKIINAPEDIQIKSFPALVNVTYNIGLSHYNTVYDDVEVILDYNDIKRNNQGKQKIKIKNNSSKIFNIRVMPDEVEFILKEDID